MVTGKIMALHIVIGNVARRMTRAAYAFVAEVTGVPVDTPREN